MSTPRKNITKKQAALLLAGLTLAAPQVEFLPDALEKIAVSEAQAQVRYRGRDYRDSDLNRLSWTTQEGKITSNPTDDYFDFRADNNVTYRVMAVGNVSLRSFNRDDRIRVYGRLDGRNIIASNVTRIDGGWNNPSTGNRQTLQATVVSNIVGNRFTIRYNNQNRIVVSQGREPQGLRNGQQVELTGYWRGNIFHADQIRVLGNNNDIWGNRNVQTLQGTVVEDNDRRRFRLRLRDGQTINVVSADRVGARLTRGNYVEVRGRWANQGLGRNNTDFRADSVRILNNNYFPGRDNDYRNDRYDNQYGRVEFTGEITKATRVSNGWYYTVRANGRDYTVRFNERFDRGDRVRVRGVLQNGTVVASDIDNA